MRIAAAGVVLLLLGTLGWSTAGPAGAAWVEDQTETGEINFSTGQSIFIVPDGVRNVDVEAVGGKGAGKGLIAGGRPALVKGRIAATSGGYLHVMVAGDGSGVSGGFNGGGDAAPSNMGAAVGGGGGGATDIRSIAPGVAGSLESRLIVAAGGGGAGSTANGGGKAGGAGGNAGVGGVRAESAGPGNTVGSGGFGGAAGGLNEEGIGGAAGYPYGGSPGSGLTGIAGLAGAVGIGGNGGTGPTNTPAGWGGGGGAGVYGGGGGGGGGTMTSGTPTSTGGGGGGGGSSFVPSAGTWALENLPSTSFAKMKYTIPGTEINAGPAEKFNSTTAVFEMVSTEAGSVLECRIDFDEFEVCQSPLELSGLEQGPHTFRVRAVNSMDNFDPTPAVWSFTVDSISPVTTIEGGPDGRTEIRRPEFLFSSTEPGVTFNCRYDGDEFGSCAGDGNDRPGDALSYGAHTFAVRAVDTTGNVGPIAARSFEVVEASDPGRPFPPPAVQPTLKLSRVKLNRKKGTALLSAKVSTAGRIKLARTKRCKPHSLRATGRSTERLKVRAKGRGLRKLRRKHKLKLTARVIFVAEDGTRIVGKKKLTLRLKAKKKGS